MPSMYSDEPITKEELDMILESANWAPNHKSTEPWRFKVVEGQAKERFAQFMVEKYKENTPEEKQSERQINTLIEKCTKSDKIVLIFFKKTGLAPEWEELAAVSMAVQNMWLMCTAMGIGSYWGTPGAIHKMRDFVEFEEDMDCKGVFFMGKRKMELHSGNRKSIEEKTEYIRQ